MKRRIFSVLLSSALLLTALAGCGQGGEADPSGSPSDAESETATRDELIFVNYRDIRDLNPHLYAGEMYPECVATHLQCPGASIVCRSDLGWRAEQTIRPVPGCRAAVSHPPK